MMHDALPVTSGLFALEKDGQGSLIGGYCSGCSQYHFPRLPTCPYCSASGCAERPLSRCGSLYLHTVVRNRPPGYQGDIPFGFGVVELPEGLRIISRLTEANLERLRFGMPMELVFTRLHRDDEGREVISYAFAPVPV